MFQYEGAGGSVPVYVGDRWSFPRQASAATLVLLPLEAENGQMRISRFLPVWSPDTLERVELEPAHRVEFGSNVPGEALFIEFRGERIALFGNTDRHGGYGEIEIFNEKGEPVHKTSIDFYSAVPDCGLRYLSPVLESGSYRLKLTVAGENSICETKSGMRYGSDDYYVRITGWGQTGYCDETSEAFPVSV